MKLRDIESVRLYLRDTISALWEETVMPEAHDGHLPALWTSAIGSQNAVVFMKIPFSCSFQPQAAATATAGQPCIPLAQLLNLGRPTDAIISAFAQPILQGNTSQSSLGCLLWIDICYSLPAES